MRVLLPAPFSPKRTCTSPARRSKSTSRRAWTPGKRLPRPVIRRSSTGGGAAAGSPSSLGTCCESLIRYRGATGPGECPVLSIRRLAADGELGLVVLRGEGRFPDEGCLQGVRGHHRDHRTGAVARLQRLTFEEADGHVDGHTTLDDGVVVGGAE